MLKRNIAAPIPQGKHTYYFLIPKFRIHLSETFWEHSLLFLKCEAQRRVIQSNVDVILAPVGNC